MPSNITIGGSQVYGMVEQIIGNIPSGQTGVLFTASISDPEANPDDIIVLYRLTAGSGSQPGISLKSGNSVIFDSVDLADQTPSDQNDYSISRGFNNTTVPIQSGKLEEVFCKSFSIEKNAGNTTESIFYAYEIRRPL